jgi:hypothetical protein
MAYDDDDFEDRDDPQREDIADLDRDDDGFDRCLACGRAVYEGVPKCPYCGQWLLDDSEAAKRSRGWLWPVMIALLIAVILVMWHGLGM